MAANAECDDARLEAQLAQIKARVAAEDAPRIAAAERRMKEQWFRPHMHDWAWNRLLTVKEAQEFLALQGLSVSTRAMSLWASKKKGPPVVRVIGRPMYDFLSLRVWAAVEIERQPQGGF